MAEDAHAPKVGKLIGIARRGAVRAPMEELREASISLEAGLAGDHKGRKFPRRAITVLAIEDWRRALSELTGPGGPPLDLPWSVRRANLLIEGIALPRGRGSLVRIGSVVLEVTYPTQPCRRMDEAHPGLMKALHPDWRGGITCRVIEPGTIAIGDDFEVISAMAEPIPRLPG